MKKSILIISFVATALVFLLIGSTAGFFYTKATPEVKKNQITGNLISSKVVTSMTASGTVTEINERHITLENAGDSLVILIGQNALIYSLSDNEAGKLTFEDIKKGDNLNIGLKLMPDGQLEGQSVIIFDSAE